MEENEEQQKITEPEKEADDLLELFKNTLLGLHETMRNAPESQSEMSFHQTFGSDIFEAESFF